MTFHSIISQNIRFCRCTKCHDNIRLRVFVPNSFFCLWYRWILEIYVRVYIRNCIGEYWFHRLWATIHSIRAAPKLIVYILKKRVVNVPIDITHLKPRNPSVRHANREWSSTFRLRQHFIYQVATYCSVTEPMLNEWHYNYTWNGWNHYIKMREIVRPNNWLFIPRILI